MDVPDQKPLLRKHFLHIRDNINGQQAKDSVAQAADNFVRNIPLSGVNIIALYYPANSEIDTICLARKISLKQKVIFALPVIINKNSPLEFYPWQLQDKLISNIIYPQISEPEKGHAPLTPDMVIVPLVAFDKRCNRLGYGGGYYDRTIAHLTSYNKKLVTVGYAYEEQKSSELLPCGKHDIKLDFVVTQKTVYCSNNASA